jgi:uncharacterized protein
MQMMERPWGVVVHGTASVKAQPDLARVRFQVTSMAQTPAQAFAAATEKVRAVRQVLREHGISDEAVEESQLGLTSQWTYGDERKLVGYESRASFAVEVGNLDDLPSVLADLVAAGADEIQGVEFDVAAKDELRTQARRKAVGVAQQTAAEYAEAAGVRLGGVVHIDDVHQEQIPFEKLRASGIADVAGPEDLSPGRVAVSAAVILGFSINTG